MSSFDAFAASPLLRSFSPDEVAEIYDTGRPLRLARSEVLFRRGEPGGSMFVVLSGRIQLVFPTDISPKLLGGGDFLGELALVSPDHVRTATAVAVEDSELQVFGQEAFDRLLETKPRLLVSLLKWISSYLLSSEQRLTSGLTTKNQELERTLDHLQRTRVERDRQEELARTDELTGLLNRRSMNLALEELVRRPALPGEELAVLLVDLDDFKGINDSYGHPFGDAVLVAVAGILRASVRPGDLPCRIGGDEFAVVFPGVGRELALRRSEDLRRRIAEQPFELRGLGTQVTVSASLGGAFHRPGEAISELLARADRGLYESKRRGRNLLSWSEEPAPAELPAR
ncbi:MAG TPA: GGDEF domain-containing protein [Thermoanaerobaculia bacterium]|nr:GGDEF domain-containing protein [Thermoanaerobaculia bacterium]